MPFGKPPQPHPLSSTSQTVLQPVDPEWHADATSHAKASHDGHSPDELRKRLLHQIEFYFSRANLSNDTFLVSQMNAELFVPIPVVAGFSKVQSLTNDLEYLMETMKMSDKVVVDDARMRVRPNFKLERNTVIIRNIPSAESVEYVQSFLNNLNIPPIKSIKAEIGNNWFISFANEADALKGLGLIKGIEYNGIPIAARLKTESLLKHVPLRTALDPNSKETANANERTSSWIGPNTAYQHFYRNIFDRGKGLSHAFTDRPSFQPPKGQTRKDPIHNDAHTKATSLSGDHFPPLSSGSVEPNSSRTIFPFNYATALSSYSAAVDMDSTQSANSLNKLLP